MSHDAIRLHAIYLLQLHYFQRLFDAILLPPTYSYIDMHYDAIIFAATASRSRQRLFLAIRRPAASISAHSFHFTGRKCFKRQLADTARLLMPVSPFFYASPACIIDVLSRRLLS